MSKIIEREKENIVYKNKFTTVYDDVVFPNGVKGKYIRFEWNIPYGVVIIASNKKGQLLLIKQYNYGKPKWEWSLPAGMGIEGVEPENQAIAELREETGFSIKKLDFLFNLSGSIKIKNGVFFYEGIINEENNNH